MIKILLLAFFALVVSSAVFILIQKPFGSANIRISGTITKDPGGSVNPGGCGYCFTSDDQKYDCVLIAKNGIFRYPEFETYVDKKVVITAKKYEGASTLMCPISLDASRIEVLKLP